MGYTTDFEGKFKLNKKLDESTYNFLVKFSETRRMKRNVDPKYGVEGEYYVDGEGYMGQVKDSSIVDYNEPPITQPGLWCKWVPTKDRKGIEWNENEKFYDYDIWLQYIIDNFLAPGGYVLTGEVSYQGEDSTDKGILRVVNDIVEKIED